MKTKNKGQASTEYIVILAVVIIVALVVVAVMGGFIDIGRGTGEKVTKTYWRGADIGLLDWVMSAGSNDTLVIRNNLDYRIKVTRISVGGTLVDVTDFELSPGGTTTKTGAWASCTSGSAFSYAVIFTYDNVEHSIVNKTSTGVKNIDGTCVA